MNNAEQFDDQVRALRAEAAEAGDLKMVAICERALDSRDDVSTEEAREVCARIIADPRRAYVGPSLVPLSPDDPRALRLRDDVVRGHARAATARRDWPDLVGEAFLGSGGDQPPVTAPAGPRDTEPSPAPEPEPSPSAATVPLPTSPGSEATPPCRHRSNAAVDFLCTDCGRLEKGGQWRTPADIARTHGREGRDG